MASRLSVLMGKMDFGFMRIFLSLLPAFPSQLGDVLLVLFPQKVSWIINNHVFGNEGKEEVFP